MKYKLWAVILIGCIAVSCSGGKNTKKDAPPSPPEKPSRAAVTLDEAVEKAAADISSKLPKGTKVAVVGFPSETTQVSDYLMDELTFALVGRGLVVVDRAQLEAARKELAFQETGEIDQKTAQSKKWLGAECEIEGQFIFTGEAYRFSVTTKWVTTAELVVASNLTVRNDNRMISLVETLKKTKIKPHSAAY